MEPARIPYRACPLCDAPDAVELLVADCSGHALYKPSLPATQRWLQCWQCLHIFVDGYFTPQALATLFSSTKASQTPGQEIEGQRQVWARVLDRIASLRSSPAGRWLDVGFGSGSLLTTAAEYGYEVAGIDLRDESVAQLREWGFDVQAVALEDYHPAEPFDVVSLADVLEHMPFPRDALRRVRELLRPEGLLFVSMPNADAFVWRALNEADANPYWGEIEHCHNFGRKRLSALLAETGFGVVRYGISERYRACMELIARRL